MAARTVNCPSCGRENVSKLKKCRGCGADLAVPKDERPSDPWEKRSAEADGRCKVCGDIVGVLNHHTNPDGSLIHASCKNGYEAGDVHESFSRKPQKEIVLTTAYSVIGRMMIKEVEIVTAECVFGSNIFRDLFSGVRDLVGGRAKGQQNVLRDAKNECMRELEQAARDCGADAVIGVDLDYQELSGGGKSMLFLVASGTAVTLEPSKD